MQGERERVVVAEVEEAGNESERGLDSFPTLPQPRGAALGLGSRSRGTTWLTSRVLQRSGI